MTTHRSAALAAFAVAGFLLAVGTSPAAAQWQIETKDGKSNIKIGFLAQPQFESLQTADPFNSGSTVNAKNIFLRRFRILFGGTIAGKWTFFFETDSPNLGKQIAGTTAKDAGTIFLQDAFVTYNFSDAFKIEAGMMLPATTHNHGQSAASLLPVDYGPYTFSESAPLQGRTGRDYGVEIRGYPLKQHLEYRLGVFQGLRGAQSRNGFRYFGRGVWYPFAPDNGFFYTGTYQGAKRVVGIGAGFDVQGAPDLVTTIGTTRSYSTYGFDAFLEQPLNKGEQGVTAQFDWMRFDGGTLAASLPKQNTYLLEGAFHFGKGRYSPFVQYSNRQFVDLPLVPNTSYWQLGFAWWMAGHQRNLKFSGGQQRTNSTSYTQVLAQLQIFFY